VTKRNYGLWSLRTSENPDHLQDLGSLANCTRSVVLNKLSEEKLDNPVTSPHQPRSHLYLQEGRQATRWSKENTLILVAPGGSVLYGPNAEPLLLSMYGSQTYRVKVKTSRGDKI
jgi:hypothetical protein